MVVLEDDFVHNLASIHYHTWWPSTSDPFYAANIAMNESRVNYYPPDSLYEPNPAWYVPRIFFDGVLDGRYLYDDDTWPNLVSDRSQMESPLEIGLEFDCDGTNGTVHAHITAEEDLTSPDLVIHFVLTESEIDYEAGNGVNIHHNAMRQMLPDENGEPFQILNGQTIDLSRNFTLEPEWVPGHVGFVVFVQDNATKEVIQAAKSRIMTAVSMVGYDLIDSGGDGDGNFEAGETVEFSISLRNLGPLATNVSASMNADDPDLSILTSDAQFEDIPINGTVDNVDLPFTFQVSQDVEPHFTRLTVDVSINDGEISFQEQIEILVGKPDILIVNDDHIPSTYPWDYDAERFYKNALYARDETYHVWNTVTTGVPEVTVLSDYDKVIWFTGRSDHPALTPDDVSTLQAFLDAGGHLIISGQDIAEDLQGDPFLSDYLHAEFVADSSEDIWMNPVPGDPITGGLNMLSLVSGDYGAANQDSPDEIRVLGEAQSMLTYFNSGEAAALRYMNDYRLVYFAFGFESFVDFYDVSNALELRADILQSIFDWFQYEPQIGDVNQDGNVNIVDVIWVVNIVLDIQQASPDMEWAADTNGDGTVNIIDAITLVNIILGG